MTTMNRREKFISDTIRERRGELGFTFEAIAEAGGPSRSVMYKAETLGVLPSKAPARGRLAKAFQWGPDACDLLEAGRVPEDAELGYTMQDVLEGLRSVRANVDLMIRAIESDRFDRE